MSGIGPTHSHWSAKAFCFHKGVIQCPSCSAQGCYSRECKACLYHSKQPYGPGLSCQDNCQHSTSSSETCCTDENCIASAFGDYYSNTFVNCPVCNGNDCHTVKCLMCKVNTENCHTTNTCYIEVDQCHAGTHEKCCRDDQCIQNVISKCQPTTTTTTTTTKSTTKTTTSAPAQTTTKPMQTSPVQRSCKVCGDYMTGTACDTRSIYFGSTSVCEGGKEFCMTDLIHDSSGSDKIFKRCVDESTCRNLWTSQTANQNQCVQFGSVLATGNYSCHFCCTTDECNQGLLPDPSTFYAQL
uniref:Uncharacterized protein LOC111121331 isoform X1 n=1 Tax=Crassostrea virginica TaxID=6565 RepID=A0A8B8CR24_CRAVI|nr:uncharacterized protein LOC111121331 isoform X1 [Crassostrea virginica]